MNLVRVLRTTLRPGLLAILCTTAVAVGSLSVAGPVKGQSFEELLRHGQALLEKNDPKKALEAFEQANALHDGGSPDCLLGAAGAYLQLGQYKKMIALCDEVLAIAEADVSQLALAHGLKGLALMKLSGGTNRERLAEAESELRESLEERPDDNIVYTLGVLLLKMNREAEGIDLLQDYLDRASSGPVAERARRLIENPGLARELRGHAETGGASPLAPSFSLTLSDGTSLSLDELKGKVVLLDFWATWCGPCRSALPSVRSLSERLAGEPFTVVAVSADPDEEAWRRFIDQSNDDWPQYLDRDGKVREAYGVRAYPTYVVIDPDGAIRARFTGWGPKVANEIDRAIDAAKSASD